MDFRNCRRCHARRAALEAIPHGLMEKEVMNRTELAQHSPGPRLVPGSEALHGSPEPAGETENSVSGPCAGAARRDRRAAAGDEAP
jgi:hypothetical protein